MNGDDARADTGGQSEKYGERRSTSRRGFLQATAAAAAAGGIGTGLVGTAAGTGIPTPWLHRDGNLIKDPSGNQVILRGVNIVDPYRAAYAAPHYKLRGETLVEMATDQSKGWHSNIIRVPLQPQDIVASADPSISVNAGMEPPGNFSKSDLVAYLDQYVEPIVQKCKEVGAYCILDYHRHYSSGPKYTDEALGEEIQMFWETVAPRYAEDSHVIYEVYNEPVEPYAGDDVYNGGPGVTDPAAEETWLTWREEAQPWVDTIREHAPRNLVLIGSPRWTQWTYWAPKHEFDGDNLAYTAHIYTQENMRPLSKYFGQPAEEVPVWMTEFGWGGSAPYLSGDAETYGPQFGSLFENYPIHWTAWSFDFNWGPAMLKRDPYSRQNYEVADDWGRWVKNRLQAKKGQDLPAAGGSEPSPGGDSTAPTAPPSVSQTGSSATSVMIEWEAASDSGGSGLDHYVVTIDGRETTVPAGTTGAMVAELSADTSYEVSVVAVDGAGNRSAATTITATTATDGDGSTVEAIDGTMPTDPDGDGEYEDLNANGRVDSNDVVVYYEHRNEPVVTDHLDAYDYNDSGRIDYNDLVALFQERI